MKESDGILVTGTLADGESGGVATKFRLGPVVGLGIVVVLSLLISAAWLVFPYLIKGQSLLSDVGGNVKKERLVTAIGYGRVLTKSTFGPGEAQVDALFATTEYFEATNSARVVSQFRPDKNLVFFVTETTHIEHLPTQLPQVVLTIDGIDHEPLAVEGPLEVYHHRVLTIRFPAITEGESRRLTDNAHSMTLTLQNSWDVNSSPRIFEWKLPIKYPENLASQSPWNLTLILGLSAGLLSFVLTPCLIQLVIVYVMTVTGFTAQQLTEGGDTQEGTYGRVILFSGMAFAAGFTSLFTVTGAVIGHAGKEAQMFFANWSSSISVAAGVLIILIGLWIGIRSRAPLVCRLMPVNFDSPVSGLKSCFGSALTAVGFSLGCITCFGGAIIATLLVYVGSIGSALVGASVMFAFSMGIVIPFLVSALFLSKAIPLISNIERYFPYLGFLSMFVIVAFGLVLLTDNFHVVSDIIYPYLGLSR
jgi:cytochrome c-type biogenesis protein